MSVSRMPDEPCICASGTVPDDGVLARVAHRTRRTVIFPMVAAVIAVVGGWLWPGFATTSFGTALVVGWLVLMVLTVPVLLWRARLLSLAWHRMHEWCAAITTSPDWQDRLERDGWDRGVCGKPLPLHRQTGPSLLRRRRKTTALVVPVRTNEGPLARGRAVVVHGRPDGLAPVDGDYLVVLALHHRGPFLFVRPADGVVFVGDRWSAAAP